MQAAGLHQNPHFSTSMPVVAQIMVTFITSQGPSDKTSVAGL